jgi:hypothetical protein
MSFITNTVSETRFSWSASAPSPQATQIIVQLTVCFMVSAAASQSSVAAPSVNRKTNGFQSPFCS